MSTNLNLSSYDERPSSFESKLSLQYLEAVNASRFVKGFGLTALGAAFLLMLGIAPLNAAFGIGAGLFILRYDAQKFYKVLGIAVIVAAFIFPLPFISTAILSGGVLWKGWETLKTLSKEGHEDEDWKISHKRAMIGTISSGIGFALSLIIAVFLSLVLLSMTMMNH
jgi:hypothetical protein